jgi:hypothetical protein
MAAGRERGDGPDLASQLATAHELQARLNEKYQAMMAIHAE